MDRRWAWMDEELAGCKRVEATVSRCLCAVVMEANSFTVAAGIQDTHG